MAADPKPARLPAPPPRVRSRVPPGSEWEDDAVFRHTFLEILRPAHAAAVRAFGQVQFSLALESQRPRTPDDSMAARLLAAAADLRFLQGYLNAVCDLEEEVDDEAEDEGGKEPVAGGAAWGSPLRRRCCRFGTRLAVRLGVLAEEIADEVEAARRGAHG